MSLSLVFKKAAKPVLKMWFHSFGEQKTLDEMQKIGWSYEVLGTHPLATYLLWTAPSLETHRVVCVGGIAGPQSCDEWSNDWKAACDNAADRVLGLI